MRPVDLPDPEKVHEWLERGCTVTFWMDHKWTGGLYANKFWMEGQTLMQDREAHAKSAPDKWPKEVDFKTTVSYLITTRAAEEIEDLEVDAPE